VRRAVNRRVPGCVVVLFDFGPQPPTQADAKRTRKYEIERSEWERETGNKPVELGMNSVDAAAAKLYDPKRWRTSATATVDEAPSQQSAPPQFVYLGCGGQAALPCGRLFDLVTQETLVVFGVDYYPMMAADQRYQPVKAP
jgi:hypothetical protein